MGNNGRIKLPIPENLRRVLILVLIVVLFAQLVMDDKVIPPSSGIPTEFIEDRGYTGGITEYAVCGGKLFVLYDTKSIVQVYTEDGEYLRSYRFDPGGRNGTSDLYVVSGNVYLSDRTHNLYRFEDGIIAEYLDSETHGVENSSIRKNSVTELHRTADYTYSTRLGSIYRTDRDGNRQCVVERPFYLGLADFRMRWTAMVLGIGICLFFCRPKYTGTTVSIFHDYKVSMHTYHDVDEDYVLELLGNIRYRVRRTRRGFRLMPKVDFYNQRRRGPESPRIDCRLTEEDGRQIVTFRFHVSGSVRAATCFVAVLMTTIGITVISKGDLFGLSLLAFGFVWCAIAYFGTKFDIQNMLDNSQLPIEK